MAKTKTKKPQREKVDIDLLRKMMSLRPFIPQGESGDVSIVHSSIKAGDQVEIVSMRNAYMMGEQHTVATFDEDLLIISLCDKEHGCWMASHPQEIWQMRHACIQAHGKVLVGGLGLGIISTLIKKMRPTSVHEVVTVERDADVISLVRPYVESGYHSIVHSDVLRYIETTREHFDFAFLDTWQGTGEIEWMSSIVPLRRALRGRIDQADVLCWNEREMLSQVRDSVMRAAHMDEPRWECYEPLRLVAQQTGIVSQKAVHETMADKMLLFNCGADNKELQELVGRYLAPGTDDWESVFGTLWDECQIQAEIKREQRST